MIKSAYLAQLRRELREHEEESVQAFFIASFKDEGIYI